MDYTPPPVVIYNIGGSLLDLPDLPARLQRVIPVDVSPLLVVGGGPTADLVREWDRVHQLGEECAHWLALRAMQLNEDLLVMLLPSAKIVGSRNEAAEAWCRGAWPILSANDFVAQEELESTLSLPHTWEATSDSVAAWVARCWPVDRLVLLKSVELPLGATNGRGFTGVEGFVDPCFSELADRLAVVEWINLRDEHPVAVPLSFSPHPSPPETPARPTL